MHSIQALTLLALSVTALAHPKRHWHHHGTGGTGSGWAKPTGGMFSMNGTESGSFAAASSSAVVSAITETVVPLAGSTTAPAVAQLASSSPGQFFQASSSSPVAAEAAATTTSCTTSTTTVTTYEMFTMTTSSDASVMSPAASTVSPASSAAAPTISAAAIQIPSSVSSSSSSPVSMSTFSTTSLSVAPGGFYQKSSAAGGYSSSAWSSSAVASVATTFATVATSASSAATPSSTGTTTPSTGGKRGLSYNTASLTDAFAGKGMTWAYNWGSTPGGTIASGIEFVPMLWGTQDTSSWASDAASAISSGSTAVLSFNEPDLASQSNLSPSVAAANHIKYMNPLSGQAEIGSPAITNGAGTSPLMGIDWLNAFFTACAGQCKVDFVAFHWYADASLTAYFEQHVNDVIAAAAANGVGKVWLTEFAVTGGDATTFLDTVMPFLDSTPQVEKYAYFMAGSGANELLTGTSLNAIGEAYVA